MTAFVSVCAIDTSIITNQILINSQIKRINNFISKGKGIRIYKAKYTNKAIITLAGTSYLSIDGWSNGKISNPTNNAFYLKKF